MIHEVSAPDIPALAALRAAHEEGGASADRMLRYLAGEHHPQFALRPRAIWAADINAAPVAFIAGHLSQRLGCDGEVQWLYVSAPHRRTGIASALLRVLAAWFVAVDAHRICVNASAIEARQFYARLGATAIDSHWIVWEDVRVVLSAEPST